MVQGKYACPRYSLCVVTRLCHFCNMWNDAILCYFGGNEREIMFQAGTVPCTRWNKLSDPSIWPCLPFRGQLPKASWMWSLPLYVTYVQSCKRMRKNSCVIVYPWRSRDSWKTQSWQYLEWDYGKSVAGALPNIFPDEFNLACLWKRSRSINQLCGHCLTRRNTNLWWGCFIMRKWSNETGHNLSGCLGYKELEKQRFSCYCQQFCLRMCH